MLHINQIITMPKKTIIASSAETKGKVTTQTVTTEQKHLFSKPTYETTTTVTKPGIFGTTSKSSVLAVTEGDGHEADGAR